MCICYTVHGSNKYQYRKWNKNTFPKDQHPTADDKLHQLLAIIEIDENDSFTSSNVVCISIKCDVEPQHSRVLVRESQSVSHR